MLETQTQTEQAKTEVKQTKTKRTSKRNTLILTDSIKEKVSESLRLMISEVKGRKQEKSAETLIRENLEFINELSQNGSSMKEIFARINSIFKLKISPASFAVYVRRIKQKFNCNFCETQSVIVDCSQLNDITFEVWICKKCNTMYKGKNNKVSVERISKKVEGKMREGFAKLSKVQATVEPA